APQAPAPQAPAPLPQQNFAQQSPQPEPAAEQLPPIPAPAPSAPAPAPAESAPIDPSQYGSVEPWPGYKGAKIADIMENLENIFRNQGDRAREKLAHVWGYESAQARPRQRLLRKLQEIAENGISPSQAPAPATPQPPAPPVAPP